LLIHWTSQILLELKTLTFTISHYSKEKKAVHPAHAKSPHIAKAHNGFELWQEMRRVTKVKSLEILTVVANLVGVIRRCPAIRPGPREKELSYYH
jgi:hypothetical protein